MSTKSTNTKTTTPKPVAKAATERKSAAKPMASTTSRSTVPVKPATAKPVAPKATKAVAPKAPAKVAASTNATVDQFVAAVAAAGLDKIVVRMKDGAPTVDVSRPAEVDRVAPKVEAPKVEALGPLESIQLPAKWLAAALVCAAKNDGRYYLNAVHLVARDPQTIRVESSNGVVAFCADIAIAEPMPAWALGQGVLIVRDRLAGLCRAAGTTDDDMVEVGFGSNHAHVIASTLPDWARFRLDTCEGQFPDLDKVAAQAQSALMRDADAPMATGGLDPAMFKLAGQVASALNTSTVQPFIAADQGCSVFTFGAIRAVLYVMNQKDAGALHSNVATLLAPAITRSAGALKAHETRLRERAKGAKTDAEREELLTKARDFAKRIAALVAAATATPKLEAPKA